MTSVSFPKRARLTALGFETYILAIFGRVVGASLLAVNLTLCAKLS